MLFKKLKGGGEINTFCPKAIYYKENYLQLLYLYSKLFTAFLVYVQLM